MRRWRGAAMYHENEASGETKRAVICVGADPINHALNSELFRQPVLDCRFVIRVRNGLDVRENVVLPVDVDHFIEQHIELLRRERRAEASYAVSYVGARRCDDFCFIRALRIGSASHYLTEKKQSGPTPAKIGPRDKETPFRAAELSD